jgi:hypothetical protein
VEGCACAGVVMTSTDKEMTRMGVLPKKNRFMTGIADFGRQDNENKRYRIWNGINIKNSAICF